MPLDPGIRHRSEAIESEHQALLERLAGLDAALDAIECYAEVYANLRSTADVLVAGFWLSGWLPEHFRREEQGLLSDLANLGPEMAAFAAEMTRQHREITARLQTFCQAAVQLEGAADLDASICSLKQTGKELTRFMVAHMGAEERKVRGLSATATAG